jgi:predicted permease
MQTLLQDLRYGLRLLLKKPGLTAVAVLTLAMGIGANTAIFSLTDKLLVRSLPVKEPQQLVLLNSVNLSTGFRANVFSHPNYVDYRDQNQVFSGMGAFIGTMMNVASDGRTERVLVETVSGNYFDLLGVRATRGRTFAPEEDRTPGTHPVAVISDSLWRRQYGADPEIIGQTVTLNEVKLRIIGVAPRQFTGMLVEQATDIWVPVMLEGQFRSRSVLTERTSDWLRIVARLKEGVTIEQARAGLDTLAKQLAQKNVSPSANVAPDSEKRIELEPGGQGVSGLREKYARALWLLLALVVMVLLIACANIANLLLARAIARRKEIAVRLALGARRSQLVRQMLTESLPLALLGGASGLLLTPWIAALLLRFQPSLRALQTPLDESIDYRVLVFTALITLLASILFGLIPALQSFSFDLIPALKEGVNASGGHEQGLSLRHVLVVAQIALAVVVLVGAGLFVKSLRHLFAVDPGFDTDQVLLVRLNLNTRKLLPFDPEGDEQQVARVRALQQQIIERVRALPGVTAASFSMVVPLSGASFKFDFFIEGQPLRPGEQRANGNYVGPDYHRTMGIPIIAGRDFSEQDRQGAPGVAIINETLARRFFAGQRAVGQRLRLDEKDPWLEIIGVARDFKYEQLTEAPLPQLDLPSLQQRHYNSSSTFAVRSTGAGAPLIPALRREIAASAPAVPIIDVRMMAEQLGDSIAAARMAATLTALFGGLALLIAVIGLYGVMSYTVTQSTRELGIRMALGAQPRDVLRLVVGQGMALTVVGVALGLIAAFALTRLMKTLLFSVEATDPLTFMLVALSLLGVALLACYVPARRATKVDPLVALRYE